jgi:hypothetical protein
VHISNRLFRECPARTQVCSTWQQVWSNFSTSILSPNVYPGGTLPVMTNTEVNAHLHAKIFLPGLTLPGQEI